MTPEKIIAVIQRYTAAFLDANLLGKSPETLLTKPPSEYPDVVLSTPEQKLRTTN